MPGNSVSRFSAITSSSGTNVLPVADRHEARQHLLRHLHARERLHVGDRVAHDHAERQREVRDVRERAPEADGQRRQDREDLAPEALVEALAVACGRPRRSGRSGCRARPARAAGRGPGSATGARACSRTTPRISSIVSARRAPVLQRLLDAGVDLVVQARDADHEELVEVGRVDRAELHPLQQRDGRVLGELEHALVELEPATARGCSTAPDRRGRARRRSPSRWWRRSRRRDIIALRGRRS